MRQIPVGPRHYAIVDDGDYDGLIQFRWYLQTGKRTRMQYAYRQLPSNSKKRREYMHQRITGFVETDHKNNNGLDNRRSNLRQATCSQNHANVPKNRGVYTSQYKGVYWNKRRKAWVARIMVRGARKYLGQFTDELIASQEYDKAAIKYFGEYAHTNFPKENYDVR